MQRHVEQKSTGEQDDSGLEEAQTPGELKRRLGASGQETAEELKPQQRLWGSVDFGAGQLRLSTSIATSQQPTRKMTAKIVVFQHKHQAYTTAWPAGKSVIGRVLRIRLWLDP